MQQLRIDRRTDEQEYRQRLLDFGVEHRVVEGALDSSHMVLDIVYGTRATRSIGNHFELARLTPDGLGALAADLPRHHWFDNQPLIEM